MFYVVELNSYAPMPFVFTEVAHCLTDSINKANYSCKHLINQIDSRAYSIVLGSPTELMTKLKDVDTDSYAIFNFEQLSSNSSLLSKEYFEWLSTRKVLDYHYKNIEFLKSINGSNQCAMELPIVPSSSLITTGNETSDIDVLFYGTLSHRREVILKELECMGLKVERVVGSYGNHLTSVIRRSKLVLNIHFYETKLFPVTRILQPAIMGIPIVCETSVFSAKNDWSQSGIVLSEYSNLVETCVSLVQNSIQRETSANKVKEFCKSIEFTQEFNYFIDFLLTTRSEHFIC